jgi:hypothetical protein
MAPGIAFTHANIIQEISPNRAKLRAVARAAKKSRLVNGPIAATDKWDGEGTTVCLCISSFMAKADSESKPFVN